MIAATMGRAEPPEPDPPPVVELAVRAPGVPDAVALAEAAGALATADAVATSDAVALGDTDALGAGVGVDFGAGVGVGLAAGGSVAGAGCSTYVLKAKSRTLRPALAVVSHTPAWSTRAWPRE